MLRTMGRVVKVTRIPKKKQPALDWVVQFIYFGIFVSITPWELLLPFAVSVFHEGQPWWGALTKKLPG